MNSIGETKIKGDWRKAEDEVPDDERRVLCCTRTKSGLRNIVIGYYIGEHDRWACGMNTNVTHWMELPDPPEDDE